MGSPKQLLDLDGKPLLQHVLDAVSAARLDQTILVLGASHRTIHEALTIAALVDVIVNVNHEAGQSTSLRAGLDAVRSEIDRVVVLLGDQPAVTAEAIRRVAGCARGPIVRASYGGRLSHPVALDRSVWALVADQGDQGARDLMSSQPELVHMVAVDGPAPSDIDTPEDYLRAMRMR
jgi:molybdenum cofactor cytidylyltransferase